MRFAYADPPYLGQCSRYGHDHQGRWDGTGGGCWDEPAQQHSLVAFLVEQFPDGWALSLSTPSLRSILPECPPDVRVMAWVKPFAVFKPNVNPGYCWEPVIVRGGRKLTREQPTVRDWVSSVITLRKGLAGAKPAEFNRWVLDVLGYEDGDLLIDLFPGIKGMTVAAAQGRIAL